jgi:hypothetical protein
VEGIGGGDSARYAASDTQGREGGESVVRMVAFTALDAGMPRSWWRGHPAWRDLAQLAAASIITDSLHCCMTTCGMYSRRDGAVSKDSAHSAGAPLPIYQGYPGSGLWRFPTPTSPLSCSTPFSQSAASLALPVPLRFGADCSSCCTSGASADV